MWVSALIVILAAQETHSWACFNQKKLCDFWLHFLSLRLLQFSLHGPEPHISDLLKPHVSGRNLRSSAKAQLAIPWPWLRTRRPGLFCQGLRNNVPEKIHLASSLCSFKSLFKAHFIGVLSHCFKTNNNFDYFAMVCRALMLLFSVTLFIFVFVPWCSVIFK